MITDTLEPASDPDPHAEAVPAGRGTSAAVAGTSEEPASTDDHGGGPGPGSATERSGTRRTIRRARRARAGVGDPPPGAAPSGAVRALLRDDSGMSTVEYAIGTVAAAAFAAILYAVVSGDTILGALTGIVQRALSTTF